MATSIYADAAALRENSSHTARLISCAAEQLEAAGKNPEEAEHWVAANKITLSITTGWPAKGAAGITDADMLARIQPMVRR